MNETKAIRQIIKTWTKWQSMDADEKERRKREAVQIGYCPECGERLDTDGECPMCGWPYEFDL